MLKLDSFDKKIILELDNDARIKINNIANKIGRSKQFVLKRINKLHENKIILGYYPIVDLYKLGFFLIYKKIILSLEKNNVKEDIMESLLKNDNVILIGSNYNKRDIQFVYIIKNMKQYIDSWQDMTKRYSTYFFETYTDFISEINICSQDFLLKGERKIKKMRLTDENYDLSKIECQIIKNLTKDCRTTISKISKDIKTSIQTVKTHLKSLEEKKIILGYKPIINYFYIGYNFFKVSIILNKKKKPDDFIQYITKHPNVYVVNRLNDKYSANIFIVAKDFKSFVYTLNNILEGFDECVKHYEVTHISRMDKVGFFPRNCNICKICKNFNDCEK